MTTCNASDAHVFLIVTEAQSGSNYGMHLVVSDPRMVIDNSISDVINLRPHLELSGHVVYQEICSLEQVKQLSAK